MHQTGMLPAPVENLGDAILLPEVPPLNELPFQPGGSGQDQGVIPHRVSQGFGEEAPFEATNVVRVQPPFQSRGMTHIKQIAGEDDPIKATQLSGDLCSVT